MGGLFGSPPTPTIAAPIKEVEKPKTTTLDPDHGEAVSKARQKRLALSKRSSRSNLRTRLSTPADNVEQALYVSGDLPQTSRVMVKDEDLCVHCSLCAERCPTGAWDMQKSIVLIPQVADEVADDQAQTSAA